MLSMGTFQLTHPELLSESELREILENSCIDFSNYENLSRSELIEMYKRVAMPLPQRQRGNNQNSNANEHSQERNSNNELHSNSVSLNNSCHLKRSMVETIRNTQPSRMRRSKSPANESKDINKAVHLSNSNSEMDYNSVEKRSSDGMHEEAPLKKRQKITWP